MSVPTVALWIAPCTVLFSLELAMTPPATCCEGILSGTRSVKLVVISLYAVVCEFAMLPDMFCMAKDCACRPLTEVVIASNKPMADLHSDTRVERSRRGTRWSHRRGPSQLPCQAPFVVRSTG